MKWKIATAAVLFATLSACMPEHIDSYVPKHREYKYEGSQTAPNGADTTGSLWRQNQNAATLYTDARAFREMDIVTVKVEEVADARRSAGTDVSRDTETSAQASAFLQAAGRTVLPQSDVNLGTGSKSSMNAKGNTARSEHLMATVPAIVKTVLPNGNLFIEGHRVVLVNAEEHHFYISGVVRPIDIDQDNSVKSALIAEAEVEFTGRGVLSDNQPRGAIARFFAWIWPF